MWSTRMQLKGWGYFLESVSAEFENSSDIWGLNHQRELFHQLTISAQHQWLKIRSRYLTAVPSPTSWWSRFQYHPNTPHPVFQSLFCLVDICPGLDVPQIQIESVDESWSEPWTDWLEKVRFGCLMMLTSLVWLWKLKMEREKESGRGENRNR